MLETLEKRQLFSAAFITTAEETGVPVDAAAAQSADNASDSDSGRNWDPRLPDGKANSLSGDMFEFEDLAVS